MKKFMFLIIGISTIIPFSFAQSSEPCAPPCYKTFDGNGISNRMYEIVALEDNHFLVGGNINNKPALMNITPELKVKSFKQFEGINQGDYIRKILVDSDQRCVMTIRDVSVGETHSSIYRFNPTTGEVLWAKRIPNPAYFNIEKIVEISPGGNYLASGVSNPSGNCNGFLIEINRNTGDVVWDSSYDIGNCDFFQDIIIIDDEIYAAGFHRVGSVSKIRAGLTKCAMDGTPIWSKYYLKSLNDFARTYITAIKGGDNELVATIRGNLNSENLDNSIGGFLKLDLDGNPISGKYYTTTFNSSFATYKIEKSADGWVLVGAYIDAQDNNNDIVIIKVDSDGNVEWAKKIGSLSYEQSNNLLVTNEAIYLSGITNEFNDEGGDLLLVSLPLDGESNNFNHCTNIEDIEIIATNIEMPIYQESETITTTNGNFNFLSHTNSSKEISFFEETLCGAPTSIDDIDSNNINIYPIPTNYELFIENIEHLKGNYQIFGIDGKLLQEGILSQKILVNQLSSGIYILKMNDEQGNLIDSKKIVVQRIERP